MYSLNQLNCKEAFYLIKINERGRAKFKPAPNYRTSDVKKLLVEKIKEENKLHIDAFKDYGDHELKHKDNKYNVLSLFSGAGGLDLGLELAGLDVAVSEELANKAFQKESDYNSIRDKSIFHHMYANDIFSEALESYKQNFPGQVFTH